ncbi:MAG: hypothetical protein AAGI88_00210 [Pseudomonadota bacterium]
MLQVRLLLIKPLFGRQRMLTLPYRVRYLLTVALSLAAPSALAQAADFVQINLLLDLDNEVSTGCQQPTVDGLFEGVDQRVEIRLRPDYTPFPSGLRPPTEISSVNLVNCSQDGTTNFGAPISAPGAETPIPEGTGLNGATIIEVALPTVALADQVRVGAQIGLADAMFSPSVPPGMHDALLTVNGAPGGGDILISSEDEDPDSDSDSGSGSDPDDEPDSNVDPDQSLEPQPVPALGIVATAILAVVILGYLFVTRQQRSPGSTRLMVLAVALSGIVLAAVWSPSKTVANDQGGSPDATDPLTFQGLKAPDILALFGTINSDDTLTLRVDALLPENCAGRQGNIFCTHVATCDGLPDGCPLDVEDAVFAIGYEASFFNCLNALPGQLPVCVWLPSNPGFLRALTDRREEQSCVTLNDGTRFIGTYLGDQAEVDVSASDAYCTAQFRRWETQGCPILFDTLEGEPAPESLCGRAIPGFGSRNYDCSPTGKCVTVTNYCEWSVADADETCCNNVGGVCNGGCNSFAGCQTVFNGSSDGQLRLEDLSCSSTGTAAESLCESL